MIKPSCHFWYDNMYFLVNNGNVFFGCSCMDG